MACRHVSLVIRCCSVTSEQTLAARNRNRIVGSTSSQQLEMLDSPQLNEMAMPELRRHLCSRLPIQADAWFAKDSPKIPYALLRGSWDLVDYNWGYKSPKWGYPNYKLLITLLTKSHEPPSSQRRLSVS